MAAGKGTRPHLVSVEEVPKSTRRSVYVDLVEEFAKGKAKNAKIEGASASAALSVKKAIARLELKDVTVATVNGEVYLSKK